MPAVPGAVRDLDPFDLPEWLGEGDVTWTPEGTVRSAHHVTGHLCGGGDERLPCDLLAVDQAYPQPVADDELRHRAHQAWQHGQVLLVGYDDRLTLALPGSDFTADRVLDAIGRLALAVGAEPGSFAALLRTDG
jgi:hypothetical protein